MISFLINCIFSINSNVSSSMQDKMRVFRMGSVLSYVYTSTCRDGATRFGVIRSSRLLSINGIGRGQKWSGYNPSCHVIHTCSRVNSQSHFLKYKNSEIAAPWAKPSAGSFVMVEIS